MELLESYSPFKLGKQTEFYRVFMENECYVCGSDKKLIAHHMDHDRSNNHETNFVTLCPSCHRSFHMLIESESYNHSTEPMWKIWIIIEWYKRRISRIIDIKIRKSKNRKS